MDEEEGQLSKEVGEKFGSEVLDIRSAVKLCLAPCSSLASIAHTSRSFFPILEWLPRYKWKEDLLPDAIAGLTTGVMHVPQGIAYAILSGVQPVNGLYASLFAPLLYLLFGTSRHASLGSFAVVALMAGVTNERIFSRYHPSANGTGPSAIDPFDDLSPSRIASTLTFTVGLVQLATALFKLDFIATYFSDPLVAGFSTGAAVHVLFSQLDDILGINLPRIFGAGYLFEVAYRLAETAMTQTNLTTLCASIVATGFLVVGKDYLSPLVNKRSPFHVVIPYDLLVLIIATWVSYAYNWSVNHGVPIVGEIPTGLPLPQPPNLTLLPDCMGSGLAIAVVVIAVHLSMAKMLAKRYSYKIDPAQELYALGLSSTISGFFPVYPTSTALGRTMVNVESGARTQLSILFGSIFLLAVIFFIGPLFQTLPLCMLSTVIIVSLRPMFRKFKELPRLWRISKYDFFIWLASFIATVSIDVIGGLIASIAMALITVIVRTQRARWSAVTRKETTPYGFDYCVYRFDSYLLFTNSQLFLDSMRSAVDRWRQSCKEWKEAEDTKRWLVMDFSAIVEIDSMGLYALKEGLDDLKIEGIYVLIAQARGSIKHLLLSSNEVPIEESMFFPNVGQALASLKLMNVADGISVHVSSI